LSASNGRVMTAVRQGLNEAGYAEGRNVTIEYRWANDRNDRLPDMALDLVSRRVSVLIADGPSARAAKAATSTIPIVFYTGGDPVQLGLVASLSRPGSNLTGATTLGVGLGAKRLELQHELLPTATDVAVLLNPNNATAADTQLREMQLAARTLGIQIHLVRARTERDFEAAFTGLADLHARGLVIAGDILFNNRSEELAALSLRHAVPTIYQTREFAAAGGLMSYGSNDAEAPRLAGAYAGRILKGEKPGDLPVQQATKIGLIINLKTAKALGINVPQVILARADEVIE
jgi:putative tryptophan/tyrosine transport system substrate-binding protein